MGHHGGRELIARAIVIHHHKLLVNHTRHAKTGVEYCALPGGHVDPGESCVAALQRELQEELNTRLNLHDLGFVSESIYSGRHKNDAARHELVLYFYATINSRNQLPEHEGRILSPENNKNFCWIPVAEIPATNILPEGIKRFLCANFVGHPIAQRANHESPLYVFEDTSTA